MLDRGKNAHNTWYQYHGFALPTILIASVVMMMVLTTAVAAIVASRNSLIDQYYTQLGKEAAESGIIMAQQCLRTNGGIITWSPSSPLRPNTDCSGGAACTNASKCFVFQRNDISSTFVVTGITQLSNSTYNIDVSASVNRVRTSNGDIWKSYSTGQSAVISLQETPKISGGAGWADNGHIGIVVTQSRQLYGYGDNSASQILSSGAQNINYPIKMLLPSGVVAIKKAVTSGLGATYLCIIGSDDQAYCRGKPGAGEQSFALTSDWNKVSGWPSNYAVYDVTVNGYGDDAACFMVGAALSQAEVWCVGSPRYGMLGNGADCNWAANTCDYYKVNNARKFLLPGGVYAKKVTAMNNQTCVITTGNDLYCSGLNNGGQVSGTSDSALTPIKYFLPGDRKVKDVIIAGYHDDYGQSVRVLATDGTIWSSGWDAYGSFGIGSTGTNTRATTQAPVLLGGFGQSGGLTGDQIRTKNLGSKCIDNSGWLNTSGNPVVLWSCDDATSNNQGQRWIYNQDNHTISNVSAAKCLDIPGAVIANGSLLRIWDCNGSDAQRFTFQSNGLITVDANPNYCIDIPMSNTADGTRMQIRTCDNNNSELFVPGNMINGWREMIVGDNYFCAVRDQSAGSGMWCAGQNSYGQLGNLGSLVGGSNTGGICTDSNVLLQVQLPPGESVDWTRMGDESSYQVDSLVVVTKSGVVYGSGRNMYGKLGNNALGDSANGYRSCYVSRMQLPNGVLAIDVSTRDEYSTYVLGNDGSVYSVGRNNNGQLGNGSTTDSRLPVKVIIPKDSFIAY